MSGELKLQIWSLENKIKTKQNKILNTIIYFLFLCLRPYHYPHFSKIITKINKQKRQYNNNNNIKTREVYS